MNPDVIFGNTAGESRCRQNVVQRGDPGLELVDGRFDADDVEGSRRTGPVGGGPAPVALLTASDWEAAYILIRRTVPTWTPLSRRRLKEASTSSGDDGSGILPATRLTIRTSP